MRKGEMLPTTTTVADHYEATLGDMYFGSVSLFNVEITEIYYMYVVEYDSRKTGMGIEHVVFDDEKEATDCYNATVRNIKKDVLEYLQKEIA